MVPSNESESQKQSVLDEAIWVKLGELMTPPKLTREEKSQTLAFIPDDDKQYCYNYLPESGVIDATGKSMNQQSITDLLINLEVMLSQGEEQRQLAKVIRQSIDENRRIIGRFDNIPELKMLVYNVEFPYGAVIQYAYNVIVMEILRKVDSDGHNSKTFYGIVDYKQDDSAVSKANAFIATNRKVRKLKKTAIGWKFLFKWKDGATTLMPLKTLKESNPVEVAEFAVTRGISDDPAFLWWFTFTIKKRHRIITDINYMVITNTHMFGIEVLIFSLLFRSP